MWWKAGGCNCLKLLSPKIIGSISSVACEFVCDTTKCVINIMLTPDFLVCPTTQVCFQHNYSTKRCIFNTYICKLKWLSFMLVIWWAVFLFTLRVNLRRNLLLTSSKTICVNKWCITSPTQNLWPSLSLSSWPPPVAQQHPVCLLVAQETFTI